MTVELKMKPSSYNIVNDIYWFQKQYQSCNNKLVAAVAWAVYWTNLCSVWLKYSQIVSRMCKKMRTENENRIYTKYNCVLGATTICKCPATLAAIKDKLLNSFFERRICAVI